MTQLIILYNNVADIICSVFILLSFLHSGSSHLTVLSSFVGRSGHMTQLWPMSYEGKSAGGLLGKMFVLIKKRETYCCLRA